MRFGDFLVTIETICDESPGFDCVQFTVLQMQPKIVFRKKGSMG